MWRKSKNIIFPSRNNDKSQICSKFHIICTNASEMVLKLLLQIKIKINRK